MTGGVWVASYVLLWAAVLLLTFAVVVLLRQVGVLHARLRPSGVHDAGEGPQVGAPAPPVGWIDYDDARVTLVTFTSPTCEICEALVPSLRTLRRAYPGVALEVVSHAPDTAGVFAAFNVASTPYVVAVDDRGMVRGGGLANTLEQVESLLDAVLDEDRRQADAR